MDAIHEWLLTGPAWVRYRTRRDLLGTPETDAQTQADRAAMLQDPAVLDLLQGVADWPGSVLKRHNDAAHPLHLLAFLCELGLNATDAPMQLVSERIFASWGVDGIPEMLYKIAPGYGGSGENQNAWMLCDAPLVLYALTRMGLGQDQRVLAARHALVQFVRANGWPCCVAAQLGKFRGPGRKDDPCPYATLLMVRLLKEETQPQESAALQTGVDTLLDFWEVRREKKMYLFGIGSNFQKLKAPLVWFDLLHVADTLSQVPAAVQDERFQEMARNLAAKADQNQRFTAESVYLSWKNWDFGQKKTPSYWITCLIHIILRRLQG
ncbi:MAG: hypothetical protein CVU39_11425 [Chloroflexi bacterium HGW-Chloroflexi-10]|nr:MAG: hypothetical protein CVU39_11425 [Chloroflexi bacterium HGW-Chloroflexi-10]